MNIQRHFKRLTGVLTLGGLAAALSGCVVAPVGYDGYSGYGGYPSAQVYVPPPPVVIQPGFFGYRGHPGYRGQGGHRGYRGNGYWR